MSLVVRAVLVLGFSLCLAGCSDDRQQASDNKMFRMGERVQVGTLIYTVLDTEWLDQLGDAPAPRMPRNRFLTVRVSVTNSGSFVSAVPAMALVDASGQSYAELADGIGVPEWLGYVRSLKPAETLHGRVAFDAPTGAYQLRLVNDADPDNERSALVELPLQLGRPQVPVDAAAK